MVPLDGMESVTVHNLPLPDRTTVTSMLSGGAGSWGATRRWVDKHGPDGVVALFTNVKPSEDSPHIGEHVDTLRFVRDAATDLGIPLVEIVADRNIWEVFIDRKWLGNAQLAHCSWELKTKLARAWVDTYAPSTTTTLVGIDWTEDNRAAPIHAMWQPYTVEMPLYDLPRVMKPNLIAQMRMRGLMPPAMYALGFAHANCVACVKAGQTHWKRVYEVFPETYLFAEQQERDHRERFDADVAILRDRSVDWISKRLGLDKADLVRDDKWWKVAANGEPLPRSLPLTLEMFRGRIQRDAAQIDLFDEGGCGCFGLPEAS